MAFARGPSGLGKTGEVDDIGVAPDCQEFSSFASAVDIIGSTAMGEPRCARGFIVSDVGVGTKIIEVVTAAGQTRAYNVTNIQALFIPCALRTITTNTTVARVLVFW